MTKSKENSGYLGPGFHPKDRLDLSVAHFLASRLFKDIKVVGIENLIKDSPFVIASAPHSGSTEMYVTRKILSQEGFLFDMMGKKEIIDQAPLILKGYRMFFIDRGGEVDNEALNYAQNILYQGGNVMIAIEQTRGRGGLEDLRRLRRAKRGFVTLAKSVERDGDFGVPIQPIITLGAENVFPIPEEITDEIGDIGFAKQLLHKALLEKRDDLTPFTIKFAPPYIRHIEDGNWGDDPRVRLRLAHIHSQLVMLENIIPAILEEDPNFPLGFYENKNARKYLQEFEELRDSLPNK